MLLAFGENKAGIAAKAVEGPVTSEVPASFLQEHPNATVYLDIGSSSGECVFSPCGALAFHHSGTRLFVSVLAYEVYLTVCMWFCTCRIDKGAVPLGSGSNQVE
jgi:hypothetical protein